MARCVPATALVEEGFEVAVRQNVALAAADVQTENHGPRRAGSPEKGDTITYSFSEAPDPGSILAGWDGSRGTGVVVHLEDGWRRRHGDDLQRKPTRSSCRSARWGLGRERLHEPGPHLRRLGLPLDDGAERRPGDDHPRPVSGASGRAGRWGDGTMEWETVARA